MTDNTMPDTEIDDQYDEEMELDLDELDESAEEPEEELEETEFEGKAYKVPKEIRDALLRQADYTKKTQELADQRRLTESQMAAISAAKESDEQADEIKADLRTVDKTIKQFDNVDWQRFAAEQPAQAQAAMLQYQQLQLQRQQLANGLEQHQRTSASSREQAHQAALAKAQADLLQAMPDFNRDLAVKIRDSTASAYGYDQSELDAITDPRAVRALRDAMLWRESQAKAKAATKTTTAAPTKVVKSSSKPTVNPDKMSADQWMQNRRKQLTSR